MNKYQKILNRFDGYQAYKDTLKKNIHKLDIETTISIKPFNMEEKEQNEKLKLFIKWAKKQKIDKYYGRVPRNIEELKRIKKLDYGYRTRNLKRLSELPLYLDAFLELEYLDLSFNKLSEIPLSIGNLRKLKVLKLKVQQ